MSNLKKESITRIIIECELLMAGTVTLCIDKEEKGVSTIWFYASDGGMYVEQGDQDYPLVDFEKVKDAVLSTQYPQDEDPEEPLNWGIRIAEASDDKKGDNEDDDEDVDDFYFLDFGCWDRSFLESIVMNLDILFEDGKCTELLHEMLEL